MAYRVSWLVGRSALCLPLVIVVACSGNGAEFSEGGPDTTVDTSHGQPETSPSPDTCFTPPDSAGDAGKDGNLNDATPEGSSGDGADGPTDSKSDTSSDVIAKDVTPDTSMDVFDMDGGGPPETGGVDASVLCPPTKPMAGTPCPLEGLDCPYGMFLVCLCEPSLLSDAAPPMWSCLAF